MTGRNGYGTGVQKKTEYAGLQFLGVSAVKKLLGFEIQEAPGSMPGENSVCSCQKKRRLSVKGMFPCSCGRRKPGRSPVLRIPAEDRDHDRARLADCGNRGSVRDSASGYGKAKPRIPGQEANLPRNCGCGHGGNRAQRLHSRRGRPGDGRNTHPVRGDRLEIPQENGVPDGTAPGAGHGVLLPAVLHGAAGGEKGARGGSLLRDLL